MVACVQTSPISFVARGATKEIGDVCTQAILWLQGWCSGDNSLHPPLSPVFKSRRRRHVWVGFVVAGSLPCSERFFTGYSGFALSKNQYIQILIRPGIRKTKNHYVDVLHLNRHLVVYLFIIYLSKSIIVKNLLSKILSFLCNSFPLSFPSLSPCGVGENPEGSDK